MTLVRYGATTAVLILAVCPTRTLGQPIVCVPPPPDLCDGKSGCVVINDNWQITVDPSGQIYQEGEKVSRKELKKEAATWAKTGTWRIVVQGSAGTRNEQIISIVEMLRKAGVRTPVSCLSTEP